MSPDKAYKEAYAKAWNKATREGMTGLEAAVVAQEAGEKAKKAAKKENQQNEVDEAVAEALAEQDRAEEIADNAEGAVEAATERRREPIDRPRTTGRPTAPALEAQGRPQAYKVYVLNDKGLATVPATAFSRGSPSVTITAPSQVRVTTRRGQVSVEVAKGVGIVARNLRIDLSSPLTLKGDAGAPVLVTVY